MMKTKAPLLECVPNFSEGRDAATIDAIAAAIRKTPHVDLLHIDTSPAANRTVMTFAGAPEAVVEAAFKAIATASERIDMSQQEGVHPRIGATDVCPLVPLHEMTMDSAVQYSQLLGERVGSELGIPVFLYEHSATEPHRKSLPQIRKGQYEGMAEKMKDNRWQPDYGPHTFNKQTGATVIGARDILVAFNIALRTNDVSIAHEIAQAIRESGYRKQDGDKVVKVPGSLSKLRAIGWYMQDYESAQVSFNLLDYRVTSPLKVWLECQRMAQERKVALAGSEVIGLLPEQCLLEAGAYAMSLESIVNTEQQPKQRLLQRAISFMGLEALKPFDPQEKVLEYALQKVGWEL